MQKSTDVIFVAIGELLIQVVEAVAQLENEGMSCGIISMHSLKPFDTAALLNAAKHEGG